MLVDGRIRQMGKHILCAVQVKLLCAEANNSFLMNVRPQGLEARHRDIDPEVKLVSTNQQRVVDVLLNNSIAVIQQLRQITENEDASAARQVRRFADPVCSFCVGFLAQSFIYFDVLGVVIGQVERQRAEVEDSSTMDTSHTFQIAG